MVSVLDSGAEGSGFKSQSRRCRVTVSGKLFTPIVRLFTAAKLVAALLRVAGVTAGLAESVGSLPPALYASPAASGAEPPDPRYRLALRARHGLKPP